MTTKLPTADDIARALTALLRRETRARIAKAPAPKSLIAGGLYHDGRGALLGSLAADIAFAAYSGACFSLIPPDSAEECIKSGTLDESMRDNFSEVLNVASRLFTAAGGGRVALKSPHFPPDPIPAEATGSGSVTFEIIIDGYGSGLVCLRAIG